MYRKLTLIFVLAGVLAIILYLRPWEAFTKKPPRFVDRLPVADIIGKSNILDLSRSLSTTLYHYKIPLREFFSQEFMLSQGKSFGIDLQRPVYFFINQEDWQYHDFGMMIRITDSSKVRLGLDKIMQHMAIIDTTIFDQRVWKHRDEDAFMTYGPEWMLIYNGPDFKKVLAGVINARFNEIPPKWRNFLNNTKDDHHLEALIAFEELRNEGIENATVHLTNDSTGIVLHSVIRQTDTVSISMKSTGKGYESQLYTKHHFNVHLDVERLRDNKEDPIYKLLKNIGKKISFPTQDLLNAWEGDLAYRQGGYQTIEEKYIESELDENFNVTEVVKTRERKIQGFSLYLSLNNKGNYFVQRLFDKGILTEEDGLYRLIYSPPLKMDKSLDHLELYTSKRAPLMINDSLSHAIWTYKSTAYEFYLDSISTFSIYGRIRVPLDAIVQDNIGN